MTNFMNTTANDDRLIHSAKRVVVNTMLLDSYNDRGSDAETSVNFHAILVDNIENCYYHPLYSKMSPKDRQEFLRSLFGETFQELKRNDYRTRMSNLDKVFQSNNEYGYNIAHQEVTTVIGCKGEIVENKYPLTEKNISILSMFYDNIEVPKSVDEMVKDILQYQDYLLIEYNNVAKIGETTRLCSRKCSSDDFQLSDFETVVIDVGGKLVKLNNETYEQYMQEHSGKS